MIRTAVGYAGGQKENPTYYKLSDHTESFQVDYDPLKISYEQLLTLFWNSHNPCSRSSSSQYKSAVFVTNEDQQKRALISKAQKEKELGKKILTEILLIPRFYPAEAYHQKYRLQQYQPFLKEYVEIYPEFNQFLRSTAVARVNGYLSGYGTAENLQKEASQLGLSKESLERLQKMVDSSEN